MQVSSLVFGFGHAALMMLQAPIIFETTDKEHRVMAFSVAFVFQSIATTVSNFFLGNISNLIGDVLNNEVAGNLYVLNGATLLVLISIVIAFFFNGEAMTKSNKSVSILKDTKNVFKNYLSLLKGDTLKYILQVALVGMGAGMIVPFFSVYLKLTLNVSDGQLGNIMAISSIGTIVGGILAPIIAKRIGNAKAIILFQLLSIPFLITISFPQGIILMTIAFFFRTGLMNMAGPIISSLSMEITDDHKKTYMSGLKSLANNLFRGIGITIGGSLMYRFSYNTPYYFTIALYLLGTLIIYHVFYKKTSS
jgi:predicted MFS family arabinose efflux permease